MLNRRFKDAGLEPWLAYLALALGFSGFSLYLFYKTDLAAPVYVLIALALLGGFSETRRNDFLNTCFGDQKLKKIRVAENLLAVLPFVAFLGYKQELLSALALISGCILLALVNFRTTLNVTIPTPFYKKPFEFTVGFRNTFYLIIAAYALTGIAVSVGNFNLGIFAMLLLFVISMSYYGRPENEYYVWIHSHSARQFLLEKIKTALLYASGLALPIALVLGLVFPQNLNAILLCFLLGWSFLVFIIVGKYAAYPDEMNIPQGVLLALCIGFPPLLIVLIPYLFRQSENRLNRLFP